MKLTPNQMHLMRLIRKDEKVDGWCKVSEMIFPFIKDLPSQLVISKKEIDGGFARLTEKGNTIVDWL